MRIECIKYKWADTTEANNINFFSSVTPELLQTLDLTDYLVKGSLSDIEYSFQDIDENNAMYLQASNCTFKCLNDIYSDYTLQDFFEVYEQNNFIKFKCNIYDDNNTLVYSGIISKDGIAFNNRVDCIADILVVGYETEFKNYFQYEKIVHKSEITYSNVVSFPSLTGFRYHQLPNVLLKNFQRVTFFDNMRTSFLRYYYVSDYPYTYSPVSQMYEEDLLECKAGYNSFYDEGVSKFTYLNNLCLSKGWIWYFINEKLYIQQLADLTLNLHTIDFNETFISHSVKNETQNFNVDNVVIEAGEYYANAGTPSTLTPSFPLSFNSNQGVKYTGDLRRFVFSVTNPEVIEIRAFRKLRYYTAAGNHYYVVNHSQHNTYKYVTSNDYTHNFVKYYTSGFGLEQNYTYDLTINNYEYATKKTMYIATGVCQRGNGGYVDITGARSSSGRYYGNGNSLATTNVITDHEYGVTGNIGESMIRYDVGLDKWFTYEMDMRTEQARNNFKTYLRNANKVIVNVSVKELITNPYQNIKIVNYPYANINDVNFLINKLSFNLNTKTSNLTLQLI